jgi:type VII secretion integral membrane protein EccD
VPAPTSGLARITIRAPRRRLDLAMPHQVPVADLLPEVLRWAGETDQSGLAVSPVGGWTLRRGDGGSLSAATALAPQGVRDGDVLYLVPRNLSWPEPDYDDVVEEIADRTAEHGRTWDAAATRWFCLLAAGLMLLTGLGVLVLRAAAGPGIGLAAAGLALMLVVAGALLSRALGDGVAAATTAGFALPYAFLGGTVLAGTAPVGGGGGLLVGLVPGQLLVGCASLVFTGVLAAVAVGSGLRIFVGAVVVGSAGAVGAGLGYWLDGPGAAAVLSVAVVGGIGLVPLLAVRLGRLPLPVVSASPEEIARQPRPTHPEVLAAVVRADAILAGSLAGLAVVAVGCVAVLANTAGIAGPLLATLAGAALLLRGRLFPGLAARLPLLGGGLVGLAVTAWLAGPAGGPGLAVMAVVGAGAVVVLLAVAATADHRRGSPYLGRLTALVDTVTVLALAPVACAVLDLYRYARGLAG